MKILRNILDRIQKVDMILTEEMRIKDGANLRFVEKKIYGQIKITAWFSFICTICFMTLDKLRFNFTLSNNWPLVKLICAFIVISIIIKTLLDLIKLSFR